MSIKFFLFFLYFAITIKTAIPIDTLSFENCKNLGFDCNSEEFPDNLTLEEQKEFMLGKIMSRSNPPYHKLVRIWNPNSKFYEPPEGVQMKNHKTISNAWVLTPAVMPSVYDDGIYYLSEDGIVLTIYNYTLSLPSNYYGGDRTCEYSPPVNEYGDCRTIYTGNTDLTELNVYQDGQLIGKSTPTSFRSNKTNTFESILNIKNGIDTDHYKWQSGGSCCLWKDCCWKSGEETRCGRDERCGCEYHERICTFHSKGLRIDSLELKDSFYAEKERPFSKQDSDLIVDISAVPIEATKKINIKNLWSYSLNTHNQIIKKNFAKYKVNYLYPPQNILYVYADKQEDWYTNNVKIKNVQKKENFEIVTFLTDKRNLEECTIKVETYFNFSIEDCKIIPLEETKLSLETDKWLYATNDTITLTINFDNVNAEQKIVIVNYANQSFTLTTNSDIIETELVPVYGESLITVYLEDTENTGSYQTSIKITVYDKENYTVFIWAIIFIALLYFGIRYLRRRRKND